MKDRRTAYGVRLTGGGRRRVRRLGALRLRSVTPGRDLRRRGKMSRVRKDRCHVSDVGKSEEGNLTAKGTKGWFNLLSSLRAPSSVVCLSSLDLSGRNAQTALPISTVKDRDLESFFDELALSGSLK
jgi:hypothetical protein